jgi:hypothetical protein
MTIQINTRMHASEATATDLLVWNEVIFTWRSAVVKYCALLDHVHYKLLIIILLHTKK